MVEITEIAWLGGLLEGEGWFYLGGGKYPRIGIEMTAEDTINKVSDMWDTRVTRHRNLYVTSVNGFKAIKWMMLLLPFFGKCRRENIASIIKVWKETTYPKAWNGTRRVPTCHPDRPFYALGLCKVCYFEERNEIRRERREKNKQLLRKVG